MTPTDQELVERVERSIAALRTPDVTLSRVPNTIRQSIADVIEEQRARISSLSQSNERMAKALKPFAKAADGINEMAAEQQRPPHEFSESFGYSHLDKARTAIADLAAPPTDSRPVASRNVIRANINREFMAFLAPTPGREEIVDTVTDAVMATLAHPPADSLDAAIRELPEGWTLNQWELHIGGPNNEYINTQGPTPLDAFRAAIERVKK